MNVGENIPGDLWAAQNVRDVLRAAVCEGVHASPELPGYLQTQSWPLNVIIVFISDLTKKHLKIITKDMEWGSKEE